MNDLVSFSGASPVKYDPAIVAAAESQKALIQAAYIMAFQKPRNEEQARVKILNACKRSNFAETAIYSKPQGGRSIEGLSIRAAELMMREWGNIRLETTVIYDDEQIRKLKVNITDLETNSNESKEVSIQKLVERASDKGREVVGTRTNTKGETVYIVKATEDELQNKEGAAISKIKRNLALNVIPADIRDEVMEQCKKTRSGETKANPQDALRKLIDAFNAMNVTVVMLEKYLKHAINETTVAEIDSLRNIYVSVRDGESKFSDYINTDAVVDAEIVEDKKPKKKSSLEKAMKSAEVNTTHTETIETTPYEKIIDQLNGYGIPVTTIEKVLREDGKLGEDQALINNAYLCKTLLDSAYISGYAATH